MEWLRLLPKRGALPQTLQILAIRPSRFRSCERYGRARASERPRIMLVRWACAQPRRMRPPRPMPPLAAARGRPVGPARRRPGPPGRAGGMPRSTDPPGGRPHGCPARRDARHRLDRGPAGAPAGALRGLRRGRPARREPRRGRGRDGAGGAWTPSRVRPTRRRRLRLVVARVHDATGRLSATWFNQEHLARILSPGDELLLRGRVGGEGRRELVVKTHEVIGGPGSEGLHTTGLVPVYPATEQMPPRRVRELVDLARPHGPRARRSACPSGSASRLRLPGAADALVAVHFPRSRREARARPAAPGAGGAHGAAARAAGGARGARRSPAWPRRSAPRASIPGPCSRRCRSRSPPSSGASAGEIAPRPGAPRPMRRLLQGEVGRGRRWSPPSPSARRSRPGPRPRCWCPPRRSPSSTCTPSTG